MSTEPVQDVVVIGAGHNGLTAAAFLAKAGRRVLVLERREAIGGLAAPEEFFPGFSSAGVLADTTGVWDYVVAELELQGQGLERRRDRPDVLSLGAAGALWIHGDPELAAAAVAVHSHHDVARYEEYLAYLDFIRPTFRGFLHQPPVDLIDPGPQSLRELAKRAFDLRRLGSREMHELLRLPPMAVADWLDPWFETDQLKAALAFPAVASTFTGPRSPGSNALLLLDDAARGGDVIGGGPALVRVLDQAARRSGVEIRTGAPVRKLVIERGVVRGVELEGGEEVRARVVAAACDPKQLFLDLTDPAELSDRLTHRIRAFRCRGTTAQVLLAVRGAVRFNATPGADVEYIRIGSDMVELERAFDALKYGRFSAEPALDVHVPTVSARDLAPAGHSVVSVLVHFAPYDLEGGWNDQARNALADLVIDRLEREASGFRSFVEGWQVLSPVDIEARYGVTGGQLHHGERSLDQLLVRPIPECARYATPFEGLFLCGSGSHGGGGLTCVPGALGAAAILSAAEEHR